MENFGKFMTVLLAIIISPIINGFVFIKLWLWFIVPTFQEQPIKIAEAIGIILLLNFVTARKNKEDDKDKFWDNFFKQILTVVFIALLTLLFGWIVKMFL